MNSEEVFELIGEIDEQYILEAKIPPKRQTGIRVKSVSMAAAVLLVVILAFPLIRGYRIVCRDGNYLMEPFLKKDPDCEQTYAATSIAVPKIQFASLEEMKRDIIWGIFDEKEWGKIRSSLWTFGAIQFPDFSDLWDAQYPSGAVDKKYVWTLGKSYRVSLQYPDLGHVSIYWRTGDDFKESVREIDNFNYKTDILHDQDRGATVYLYEIYDGTKYKSAVYKLCDGNKQLWVKEVYNLAKSDSVPYYVTLYGENNSTYFQVRISNPSQRPDVQWLLEFGIEDYA